MVGAGVDCVVKRNNDMSQQYEIHIMSNSMNIRKKLTSLVGAGVGRGVGSGVG